MKNIIKKLLGIKWDEQKKFFNNCSFCNGIGKRNKLTCPNCNGLGKVSNE